MNKLIATMILGAAVSTAAAGEDNHRAQNIGVGSGAAIGAVAAGPVGLILGAAIGGHYADRYKQAAAVPGLEDDLGSARAELNESAARIARLNHSLGRTQQELAALSEEMSGLLLERAAFEGLQMEVMYPTGESALGKDATARIERLAELLIKLPDLAVRLDGYADPRGDEGYNESLSRLRAESVRAALVGAGISADRITLHAHGESAARQTADLDAYALERKVRVRLYGDASGAKVAQQD